MTADGLLRQPFRTLVIPADSVGLVGLVALVALVALVSLKALKALVAAEAAAVLVSTLPRTGHRSGRSAVAP